MSSISETPSRRRAPLDRGLNVAVRQMAGRCWPVGFDISPDAPTTIAELREQFERRGRISVAPDSERYSVFADAEAAAAFRAWLAHYCLTRDPEDNTKPVNALLAQMRVVYGPALPPLWARVIGLLVGCASRRRPAGTSPLDEMAWMCNVLRRPIPYLDSTPMRAPL